MKPWLNRLSIPQIIVATYSILILFGGLLLSLPFSSTNGDWTSYLDAVFTATSAICVTGQVVVNTAQHWSPIGKTIIISLIQIGGIGFMTLWMLFFMLRGQKTNLKQRRVVFDSLNLSYDYEMKAIVGYIVKFTLSVQLFGAALLFVNLGPKLGVTKGILYSLFHSISAFNNAGFDLFGDSLIGFQDQPYVILVIAGLIISGGLGFLVWRDLLTFRKNRRLLKYTKIVVITTFVLILMSTILLAITEYHHQTFQNLDPLTWLTNIFFMAVTPRTAGYANIDYAIVSKGGIFITLVLMFIGGASGSTAGGVKVSTVTVVLTYLYSTFRGRPMTLYSREIKNDVITRSFFLICTAFILVMICSFILIMTETIPQGFGIEYILVEVFSCFGTVGLSMGLTAHLTMIGKIILIMLMLIGKVGLITFLWSIGNHDKEWQIKYPEINIMIG